MRQEIDYLIIPVESADQLPESIAITIRQYFPSETLQRIMIVPPQEQLRLGSNWASRIWLGWQKIPQRTLVFSETQIAVIEADWSGDLNVIAIPIMALTRITFGKVLLYAYAEFVWDSGEAFRTLRVEFHVANDDLINEQINRIRAAIAAHTHDAGQTRDEVAALDVETLPFKFRHYLRRSLLPAEHVQAAIFQPAIRQRMGRWFRRTIAPDRVIALTDQHVILVEEELNQPTSSYSVITHYYPIHYVRQVRFATMPDTMWMHMSVGTADMTQDVDIPLGIDEADRLNEAFSRYSAVAVENPVAV